ncbi:uncharacterized protein LOC144477744 [Augochlora pura]
MATVNVPDRVGVSVPEFDVQDPELWFCIVERSFRAARITSDAAMMDMVASALSPRYRAEVWDVLLARVGTESYETLKTELIRRVSVSQEQKAQQLLKREEIGDWKPSQFLRHLQNLTGSCVTESLLRTLWRGGCQASGCHNEHDPQPLSDCGSGVCATGHRRAEEEPPGCDSVGIVIAGN